MHVVMYGSEGSGKGTQAKLLADYCTLPIYTSGDLVRSAAAHDKSSLGDFCREALSSGTYVADEHMFILWNKTLSTQEAKNGFILDGFPRTRHQAEFLLSTAHQHGYAIDHVIHLKLSDEEAVKRLAKRKRTLFAGSTVSHDTPERIQKRLSAYRSAEQELLQFFQSHRILREINAEQSVENVWADIRKKIQPS